VRFDGNQGFERSFIDGIVSFVARAGFPSQRRMLASHRCQIRDAGSAGGPHELSEME